MDIRVGDIVTLKKQHPCGSRQWTVLRSGADFRIQCLGCSHQLMLQRKNLEKSVTKVQHANGES
jgi:hypothetical protein